MNDMTTHLSKVIKEIKSSLISISPFFDEPYKGPASLAVIKELSHFVGLDLPAEFVSFYSLCNGSKPNGPAAFAYELEFLSIEDCLRNLKVNVEVAEEFDFMPLTLEYADPQIDADMEYSKYRIPFAAATRQQICIDLRPTPSGTTGQVVFIDSEYKVGIYLAKTITEFLEQFQLDLDAGLYSVSARTGGYLCCDKKITLVNWQWSTRWENVPFDRSILSPYDC